MNFNAANVIEQHNMKPISLDDLDAQYGTHQDNDEPCQFEAMQEAASVHQSRAKREPRRMRHEGYNRHA